MTKQSTAPIPLRDRTIAFVIAGGALMLALAYAFFFPSLFPGFAG